MPNNANGQLGKKQAASSIDDKKVAPACSVVG
jgi:hypothetical protein